jgi:hypothetical protein
MQGKRWGVNKVYSSLKCKGRRSLTNVRRYCVAWSISRKGILMPLFRSDGASYDQYQVGEPVANSTGSVRALPLRLTG